MTECERHAYASLVRELERTEQLYKLVVGVETRIIYRKRINALRAEMAKYNSTKKAA